MKYRYLILSVLVLVMLSTALVIHTPGIAQSQADGREKLVGTWRLISAKYGGQESTLPQEGITLKHITPTHFTWMTYEDKTTLITRAGGGTYALHGEKYTESAQYGIGNDFEVIKRKDHSFSYRIEGGKWHNVGALDNGREISEVWELIK
jgi:hypothetical protein